MFVGVLRFNCPLLSLNSFVCAILPSSPILPRLPILPSLSVMLFYFYLQFSCTSDQNTFTYCFSCVVTPLELRADGVARGSSSLSVSRLPKWAGNHGKTKSVLVDSTLIFSFISSIMLSCLGWLGDWLRVCGKKYKSPTMDTLELSEA